MKTKRIKGFTLIELLAVLVVLAILALITTPIVLNVIKQAREGANERSAESYLRSLEYAVTECMSKHPNEEVTGMKLIENGTKISIDGDNNCADVETKGKQQEILTSSVNLSLDEKNKIIVGNGKIPISIGNLTFYVYGGKINLKKKSLDNIFWNEIATKIANGNANYEVGDTKCVAINGLKTTNDNGCDNGEFLVRISNTSTPNDCKESNFSQTACGYVFEFVDIIERKRMNPDDVSSGGYKNSELKAYLNEVLLNRLPEDLRSVIKTTKVISSRGRNDSENFLSDDYIYLLSTHEVYESDDPNDNIIVYNTAWNQTRQLDYYKDKGLKTNTTVDNIKNLTKKKYQNSVQSWWFRTSDSFDANSFNWIPDSGTGWGRCSAGSPAVGVSPAFKVG